MLFEKLTEGNIIYTTCSNYAAGCYHLGIVFEQGDTKLIYHNDPSNINKFGGSVCAETYDQFMKGRVFQNVIRTNAKNKDILDIAQKCKFERWNTFTFNCEDFVLEIVDGKRRSDLRDVYKLAALGTSTLLLL